MHSAQRALLSLSRVALRTLMKVLHSCFPPSPLLVSCRVAHGRVAGSRRCVRSENCLYRYRPTHQCSAAPSLSLSSPPSFSPPFLRCDYHALFINAAVTKHNAFSVHAAAPMEGWMHDMYCTPRRNSCEFDSRNLAQHDPGHASGKYHTALKSHRRERS